MPLSAHGTLIAVYLVFFISYFVFAAGRLPGTRVNRSAMAVIGAVLMLAVRALGPAHAVQSIDFGTIVLLFAMMVVTASLHLAGFFEWTTALIVSRLRPRYLLAGVIFSSGVLSAFLVNDVVCLVMAPLILSVAKRLSKDPLPYLLGLATASNIGSTATITGNPQNILIGSVSHIGYLDFLLHLGPVALAGLFLDWWILSWMMRSQLNSRETPGNLTVNQNIQIDGKKLIWPLLVSVFILVGFLAGFPPPLVAALGAALLLLSPAQEPGQIYDEVDWSLLLFFVGLFIVIGAAERAGIAGQMLSLAARWDLHKVAVFSIVTTLLSNVVSNVPAVMLLKNSIAGFSNPHHAWLLLAMVSTLAGNLTITGSVANIIVIEKTAHETPISFMQYLRIGVPVTLATMVPGILWLHFFR